VSVTVTEVNDSPTVMSGPAQTANENDLVTITSTFADVDANQTHTCSINWGDGSASTTGTVTETGDHTSGSCSGTHRYLDDAPTATPSDTYVASVTVTDNGTTNGSAAPKSGFANTNVTINNVTPVIASATGPSAPTDKASPITVSALFSDVGTLDTHVCKFTWDDGTTTSSATPLGPSVTSCSATHTYTAAGVYDVSVTVTDDDTGSDKKPLTSFVVIYDPNSGFVTGGGYINHSLTMTPAGTGIGKDNFGFVAKYKKGASAPDGETEFQCKVCNINFHSTSLDWLVVTDITSGSDAGAQKAQYQGSGTNNGTGNYQFQVTVIDKAGTDYFRIHIWNASGTLYDNMPTQPDGADPALYTPVANSLASGGSIVIHK
jgi:hypothetical protein